MLEVPVRIKKLSGREMAVKGYKCSVPGMKKSHEKKG